MKKWKIPTTEDKNRLVLASKDIVPKDKARLKASMLKEIAIKKMTKRFIYLTD